MNTDTFDPGPGWTEITYEESVNGRPHLDEYDDEGYVKRRWIRDEPVPPLPTEQFTVIDARFKDGGTRTMVLWSRSWYYVNAPSKLGFAVIGELEGITGFEVLARPAPAFDDEAERDVVDQVTRDIVTAYDSSGPLGLTAVNRIRRLYGLEHI